MTPIQLVLEQNSMKTITILFVTLILFANCARTSLNQTNLQSDTKDTSMKEVLKKRWSYVLYESGQNYILSVLCGTVGLYELRIQLNEEEVAMYKADGVGYIENLVKTIQAEPDNYTDRRIDN